MIVDAAYEAYADAGIEDPQRQIEAVFAARSLPARRAPPRCADALKLFGKPVSMVVELLRDRHRRVPLRRVRGRGRHVRHGAGRRLRQAEGPRRLGPERRRSTGVRGLPATPAGWFSLCAAQLLRDVRRRPRGPREDRGQEPPQRHARAEVDAEARDHGRGRARRRASSRGRSGSTTAPRSPTAPPPRSSRARELAKSFRDDSVLVKAASASRWPRTRRRTRASTSCAGSRPSWAAKRRLRAGRHHRALATRSTSRRCTTASR